jgi:hypothetical protein
VDSCSDVSIMFGRQSRPADPGGELISVSHWIAHICDSLSYCAAAVGTFFRHALQPYQISAEVRAIRHSSASKLSNQQLPCRVFELESSSIINQRHSSNQAQRQRLHTTINTTHQTHHQSWTPTRTTPTRPSSTPPTCPRASPPTPLPSARLSSTR